MSTKPTPRFAGFHQWPSNLGGFEVFTSQDGFHPAGWYWWACMPGCLLDGDAYGPFKTAAEAYQNALSLEGE